MKKNMATRIFVSLPFAALLTACAPIKPLTDHVAECGCSNNSCQENVTITYGVDNSGHSLLRVKDKTTVGKQQLALVFKLDPRPGDVSYETTQVTVVGKSDNPQNAWIKQTSGAWNPDKELVVCIPPNQQNGTYFYDVLVKDFGTLDPRVIVDK